MRTLKILTSFLLLLAMGYLTWTASTNFSARLYAESLPRENSPEAEELLKQLKSIPTGDSLKDFLKWIETSARWCLPNNVVNVEFGIPASPSTLSTVSEALSALHQKIPKMVEELIKANQQVEARNLMINAMRISRTLERTYEVEHIQKALELEKKLLPKLYELLISTEDPSFLKEMVSLLQEVERIALPFDDFIKAQRAKIARYLEQPSLLSKISPAIDKSIFYWWFHKREVVEDVDRIYTELEARAQQPPHKDRKPPHIPPATEIGKALQAYGKQWDALHPRYALHSTLTRLILLESASRAFRLGNPLFDPDNPKSAHPIHSDLRGDPFSGRLLLKRRDGKWYSTGGDGKDDKGSENDLWLPQALELLQHQEEGF